ncbi:MAG: GNAT family N-acetyltransferase [Firmicutes bacterium]|nr:GNAT family N-acetyltransferase [Bacillota bacterium]
MAHIDALVLITDRLMMRPYRAEDAEIIFAVVERREVAETMTGIPHPYPRKTVDWWIRFTRDNIKKGEGFEFGLFRKDEPSAYIGNCGLIEVSKEHRNAELVYFIRPDVWNQGFGTEACMKAVEFGFGRLGLERIGGRCMAKNIGSRRVMEKAGFRWEGLARHEILKWGKFEDTVKYGLIRAEWDEIYRRKIRH